MPKYVVLYTAPSTGAAQMEDADPAMAEAVMKAWYDWSAKVGNGMVDLGLPLGQSKKVTSSGTTDTNTEVAGYSILSADSLDSALGLVGDHPHLQMPGSGIEVYEAVDLPG